MNTDTKLKFRIINGFSQKVVEHHKTEATAIHGMRILNEHEENNNRPPVYAVETLLAGTWYDIDDLDISNPYL